MADDQTSIIEYGGDMQNGDDKDNLALGWVNLAFTGSSLPCFSSKLILSHLHGYLNFGTLTALMGPSGCGKSTLLKCINGRNNSGINRGTQIYVNRKKPLRQCFIVQDENEHLLVGLTVRESLMYASKLKNNIPAKSSIEYKSPRINHKQNVEKIMSELMLSDASRTVVEKCSGGERKRISIALELTAVRKPNLICIDEPTSGLDSNAAEVVIKCLKDISHKHNIAIVTSIHQPNSDVLMMYNEIYVLAKGGICVYFGPPGNLRSHLSDSGIECFSWQIPIEVLLKISSSGMSSPTVKALANQSLHKNKALTETAIIGARLTTKGIETYDPKFSFIDLWYLFLRSSAYSFRSQWKAMILQYVIIVGIGAVLSQLYNKDMGGTSGCLSLMAEQNTTCTTGVEKLHEEEMIKQNMTFNFFEMLLLVFLQTIATTLLFSAEVKIFVNEHSNGWYSTGAYYWAKTVVELPLAMAIVLSFATIAYYGSEQIDDDERFALFLYFYISATLCSQGLGFFIGIITLKNENLSLVYAIGFTLIWAAFSDFLSPVRELPKIFQGVTNISFVKHIYKGILISIFGRDRCPSGEVPLALYYYELEDKHLWYYMIAEVFHIIYLRILALLALLITVRPSSAKNMGAYGKIHPEESFEEFSFSPEQNEASDQKILIDDNINGGPINTEMAIAWLNLAYYGHFGICSRPKAILTQLNGQLNFRTLNALMGPSGSGKTTLLNCINGKNTAGMTLDSKIFISGSKKIRSCFISQDVKEHLLMGLTGRETLIYASKIKNSAVQNKNGNDHTNIVTKIMTDLMILGTAQTTVSKCSGGEQKRLAIGIELTSIEKPDVLCIDEPTSGLDSNAAELVVKCLKEISRTHRMAVVTSIHQPNADVLMLYDQVYVLAKGGMCIYSGTPGFMNQHLINSEIEFNNSQIPIEVLLKVGSKGTDDSEVKKLGYRTIHDNTYIFDNCMNAVQSNGGIESDIQNFTLIDLWYIFIRNAICSYRSQWWAMALQYIFIVSMAGILRYLYNKDIGKANGCVSLSISPNATCIKTPEQLHEEDLINQNATFIFFCTVLYLFLQMVATVLTFPSEVQIFLNEHKNGWYSTGAYYWAKTLIELPLPLLISSSFAALFYYGSEQIHDDERFLGVLFFFILGGLCSQGLGFLFGIIFSGNIKLAAVMSVAMFIALIFFCGFLAPVNDIHESFKYITHASFIKHAFQSIVIIIYGLDRCADGEVPIALYQYDLEDDDLWLNTIGIIFHVISFRIMALLAIITVAKPSKKNN